ncbi:hypothetical protein [Streptomyces sp. NPDC051662]|uniref:hypothetical protein n=1 Tax=Streptomyces sp. NPDC051662 TaxID=3154750 RepID=UPI0034399C5F
MTSPSNTPDSIETTTALLRGELPQLETQQQSLERELAGVTERLESVRTALGALQALSPAPQAQETVPVQRAAEPSTAETPVAEAPVVVTPVEEAPAEEAPVEEAPAKAPAKEKSAPAKAVKSRKSASASARTSTGGSGAKSQAPKEQAPKEQTAKEQKAKEPTPKERTSRPAKKSAPATATKTRAAKTAAAAAATADEQASGLTEQILAVLAASDGNPVRARDVAQALGRDGTPGSINAVRSTLDRLVGTSRAHRAGRGLYQASAG